MYITRLAARPLALPHLPLFGLSVVNASEDAVLDQLCTRLHRAEATRVAFLNAHCVAVAAGSADYRRALQTASLLLPDGSGLDLAARFRSRKLVANLNGTDLIPALCERLARMGCSVFLLGGRPGIAAEAARALQIRCPGLQIAGTHHGYFDAAGEPDVIGTINASGADVLLVAMGVPQQDVWLAGCSASLAPTLRFGVGGLFDFLSGRIPRAPRLLRAVGLEWTYRLYQEPRRMWRRYLLGNPVFIGRVVVDAAPAAAHRLNRLDPALKRALDIVGAATALTCLAPLLLLAMAAIRITSPGPALFRQQRIGQDGVPFSMLKLRSMFIDAEKQRAALSDQNHHGANGLTFKLERDPRVTPIGRWLRKTSIDELPQLWNVFKGDMSPVGPRPQLPREVALYSVAHYRRLAGKPGITCLWQIAGRADVPFEQQYHLDLAYLEKRSMLRDLLILVKTVPAVLTAKGAYY